MAGFFKGVDSLASLRTRLTGHVGARRRVSAIWMEVPAVEAASFLAYVDCIL